MLLLSVSAIFVWFKSVLFLDSADPRYLDEKEENGKQTVFACFND